MVTPWEGVPRVSGVIKAGTRADGDQRKNDMVRSVQEKSQPAVFDPPGPSIGSCATPDDRII